MSADETISGFPEEGRRPPAKENVMGTFWKVEAADGGVAVIRYHNPPMNYLDAPAIEEFLGLFDFFAKPDVRAVVIASAIPGRFITHYSVDEVINDYPGVDGVIAQKKHSLGFKQAMMRLRDLPKPVIAAINGDCMGGGFELALWCDLRIMSDGSTSPEGRIGLPEVLLNLVPGAGGVQNLTRLIGASRALELLIRGRVVKPAEALTYGMVHELAPDAEARAMDIAREMAQSDPSGLGAIKRTIYSAIGGAPLSEGTLIETDGLIEAMFSPVTRPLLEEFIANEPDQRRDWFEKRISHAT